MRFTALPVKIGDAFLLEDENFKVLVDGGSSKSYIITLLNEHFKKNNIKSKHIDVLICTHYDADHINGILGVINSSYTFKEIWLPKLFGDIAYTMSKNMEKLIDIFNDTIPDYKDETLLDIPEGDFNTEDIDLDILEYLINIKDKFLFDYLFFCNSKQKNEKFKYLLNLFNICEFVYHTISTGFYVIWLKTEKNEVNEHINPKYSIYALNSKTSKISSCNNIKDLFKYIYLSDINKYSLVFLFNDTEKPNILFSADSDLNFINSNILLKDNSIVTAPHHGSDNNSIAYSKINGKDLNYIRSDYNNSKRPCSEYKNLSKKYCTVCNTTKIKIKVEFNLSKGIFNTTSKICSCV